MPRIGLHGEAVVVAEGCLVVSLLVVVLVLVLFVVCCLLTMEYIYI